MWNKITASGTDKNFECHECALPNKIEEERPGSQGTNVVYLKSSGACQYCLCASILMMIFEEIQALMYT